MTAATTTTTGVSDDADNTNGTTTPGVEHGATTGTENGTLISDDDVKKQNRPPKLAVDRDWLQKLLRKHNPDAASSSSRINAYAVAPMVDQSDLPFRLQCRKYGANLCFTPMIHARLFATSEAYRQKFMPSATNPGDRPLIAQLCGSDPQYMEYTAKAVAPYCDAIDINCGCPQSIAKRGMYGAFLLEAQDTLLATVQHLLRVLDKPLTVKVRLLPAPPAGSTAALEETEQNSDSNSKNNKNDPAAATARRERRKRDASVEASLALYGRLVDAGIHMLTVHGRTRFHKGAGTGRADWGAVAAAVRRFGHRVPVLANGSIADQGDVRDCLRVTGADGVVSSEAILEYPPLFQGMMEADAAAAAAAETAVEQLPPPPPPRIGRLRLAREYLELAALHPPHIRGQGSGIKCVRVHIHRFLHADLQIYTDIRQQIVNANCLQDLKDACARLELKHQDDDHDVSTEQLSWYMRHRTISRDCFGITVNNGKNTEKTILQIRTEQERTVKQVDLVDDAADCFANLFGE